MRRFASAVNAGRRAGVVAVVGAPGCDDVADSWMTLYRRPLVGFVLPYVNGDVQAAEDVGNFARRASRRQRTTD